MTEQSIGMMQGAFFVPKGDLLNWVNSLLKLSLTKIEQLGTGAVYCNIIDAMYPGKVAMQRINWKARNQWQFINNYKILQQSFLKCKIQKYIDIEKLCKSKYQDNLEFIQWIKRYYDLHNTNHNYNPQTARKNAPIDFTFVQLTKIPKKRQNNHEALGRSLTKSKESYDEIRSKVNHRSMTVEKHQKDLNNYYLSKLTEIKSILKDIPQKTNKLKQIQAIIEEVHEQSPDKVIRNSQLQKLQTIPSEKAIKSKKNK